MFDVYKVIFGGRDFRVSGRLIVCGEVEVLCWWYGYWKFGLVELVLYFEYKKYY